MRPTYRGIFASELDRERTEKMKRALDKRVRVHYSRITMKKETEEERNGQEQIRIEEVMLLWRRIEENFPSPQPLAHAARVLDGLFLEDIAKLDLHEIGKQKLIGTKTRHVLQFAIGWSKGHPIELLREFGWCPAAQVVAN